MLVSAAVVVAACSAPPEVSSITPVAMLANLAPSNPEVGSSNPATAYPAFRRPDVEPCTVELFNNIEFKDLDAKPFDYRPPDNCRGPWSLVLLEGDFTLTGGVQYDRTLTIWIGGVNLFFGTTPETDGATWSFENDLTEYAPLLAAKRTGSVLLENQITEIRPGAQVGSAKLVFYPESGNKTSDIADAVLALSSDDSIGPTKLESGQSLLAKTFTLPTNIERAYIDVYAQSQNVDEQWYNCLPDDVFDQLQALPGSKPLVEGTNLCSGTSYRETLVTIDGKPAGLAPIYPWIYTGGILPQLWRPTPGVQTLDFEPYRVDLTPFAGLLSNGQSHEIAIQVTNAHNGFSVTGTIVLYQDDGADHVDGEVTTNTLEAEPDPNIEKTVDTVSAITTSDVKTNTERNYEIAGFVNTSKGRVRTQIVSNHRFSNVVSWKVSDVWTQQVRQNMTVTTTTQTRRADDEPATIVTDEIEWPLDINFQQKDYDGKQATYVADVIQRNNLRRSVVSPAASPATSRLANSIVTSATSIIDFVAQSGQTSGDKGNASSVRLELLTPNQCFVRSLEAADNKIVLVETPDC